MLGRLQTAKHGVVSHETVHDYIVFEETFLENNDKLLVRHCTLRKGPCPVGLLRRVSRLAAHKELL